MRGFLLLLLLLLLALASGSNRINKHTYSSDNGRDDNEFVNRYLCDTDTSSAGRFQFSPLLAAETSDCLLFSTSATLPHTPGNVVCTVTLPRRA
jgi:hypothetical protein